MSTADADTDRRVDRSLSLILEGSLLAIVITALVGPTAVAWVAGFAALVAAAAVLLR